MPLGFLVVFSEPGAQVSLEEFQDWYNNEHVPLRMNHLPSFLSGARYAASDSLKPGWLALYDIDDTSTFQHESYTRLRANRSLREAALVKRLEVLDRRTCEAVCDSGESPLTSSLMASNPTQFLYTHGVERVDRLESFDAWANGAFESLKGLGGWVRSRGFRCIDNLRTGTIVGPDPAEQTVSEYFMVHELLSAEASHEVPNFLQAIQGYHNIELTEGRRWNLYRAYPGISQRNSSS